MAYHPGDVRLASATAQASPTALLADLLVGRAVPEALAVEAWPAVARAAAQHRLAPNLYYALAQAAALDRLPADLVHRLRSEYHQAKVNSFLAVATAREWSQRFAQAGIQAVWLKGVALALTVYPEPGLRAMTDVDVLVPAQQAEAAMRLIAAVSGRQPVTLGASLDKHAVADVGPANSVRLEVHWSLVDLPHQPTTEDTPWFLASRTPLPGGADFFGLAPEAHLLYLCAHAEIVHGEADFLLQRYFDLHRLVISTPELDWGVVVERAADFGWTYAVERALQVTQRFFGTPLSSSVLDDLRCARPAHENMARVTRRQEAVDAGERLLRRWDGLDWSARLRLAVGSFFPSPAYMRRRYGLGAGWQVALAYPYRWASALARVGKALAKRLAAPNRHGVADR